MLAKYAQSHEILNIQHANGNVVLQNNDGIDFVLVEKIDRLIKQGISRDRDRTRGKTGVGKAFFQELS